MRCPSCGNEEPARPVCLPALWRFVVWQSRPAGQRPGPVPIPLTFGQKARLLVQCWPPVAFALMVAGYLVVVSRGMIPAPPPLFYVFVGVVILFTGFDAIQSLRDLVSGVALAQEDLLNQSHPGRGPRTYYGHFERLGKLRMIPKAHFQNSALPRRLQPGQPNRLGAGTARAAHLRRT